MKASHLGRVVANLLDVVANLLHNLIVPLLVILGLSGIHLVQGHNDLSYAQREGQQGMLTGLAILADASLEPTWGGINDEHSAVSLASACRATAGGFGNMHADTVQRSSTPGVCKAGQQAQRLHAIPQPGAQAGHNTVQEACCNTTYCHQDAR